MGRLNIYEYGVEGSDRPPRGSSSTPRASRGAARAGVRQPRRCSEPPCPPACPDAAVTRSNERIRKIHDFSHSVLQGGAQPSRTPAPRLLLASAQSTPHTLSLAGASSCQETLPQERRLSICHSQTDRRRHSWLRAGTAVIQRRLHRIRPRAPRVLVSCRFASCSLFS